MPKNGFNIILGGKIDRKILQSDITSLNNKFTLKVKLDFDTSSVQNKLNSVAKNFNSQIFKSSGQNQKSVQNLAKSVVKNGIQTDTYKQKGNLYDKSTVVNANKIVKETYNYESALKRAEQAQLKMDRAVKKNAESYDNVKTRINYLGNQGIIGKKAVKQFNSELARINKIQSQVEKNKAFKQLNQQISDSKKQVMGFGQQLKTAYSKFAIWSVATVSWYGMVNAIKSAVQEVKNLDASLVELNKVVDLTNNQLETATQRAFDLGSRVGKTGTEVLDAVTAFKRAGYELNEAFNLAELALTMTNVAEGIEDTADASGYLIAIMKGFGDNTSQFAQKALDAINEVSNNAAVTFDDLSKMLQRTSGTLAQQGVEIEELIGMLTRGFAVLRNESKVSSGLITIGARIRGVDENGEEIEGLQSELQEAFKTYADVDIMDANNELRSTYDILGDVARNWEGMSANAKQFVAEISAGKRQMSVFNAIVSDWSEVEDAVKSATESQGSAANEQEAYLNSIEG